MFAARFIRQGQPQIFLFTLLTQSLALSKILTAMVLSTMSIKSTRWEMLNFFLFAEVLLVEVEGPELASRVGLSDFVVVRFGKSSRTQTS